jgi:hypothetical protein
LLDRIRLRRNRVRSISVANLLRKALIVAAKLGVLDVPQWIERELSGYNGIEVPNYRIVRGRAQAKIMESYIDLQFANNETEGEISPLFRQPPSLLQRGGAPRPTSARSALIVKEGDRETARWSIIR